MASTMQKSKVFFSNKQLHTAVFNPQGSKQFLKKIVPMSVSFILHQRMELNEKNFQKYSYGGVELQAFKPKLENVTLQMVRDWVNSAMTSLDKNYLRELYLILADINDPTIIFESYKFQFMYMGDDVIPLNLSSTEKELTESTDSFLRSIDGLKEHTKYKENELDIKMAATYYEDVTPPDYHQEFYIRDDNVTKTFLESLRNHSSDHIMLGLLKTGHHTLKCRGKGEVFSMNCSASSSNLINQTLDEAEGHNPVLNESELNLESEIQNNQGSDSMDFETPNSVLPCSQDEEVFDRLLTQTPTISEISLHDISDVIHEEVHCFCKISASFEHIGQIKCDRCRLIRHCVCLEYLCEDDVVRPYICPACRDEEVFTPMRENRKQMLCVYRLAVGVAYFTESFPQEVINKLPENLQEWINTKLRIYKVVIKQDDEYVINIELLRKSYIKEIFALSFPKKPIPVEKLEAPVEVAEKKRRRKRAKHF